MLLSAFDASRPTADMDVLARDFTNDEASVVSRGVTWTHGGSVWC